MVIIKQDDPAVKSLLNAMKGAKLLYHYKTQYFWHRHCETGRVTEWYKLISRDTDTVAMAPGHDPDPPVTPRKAKDPNSKKGE
jgi:hypothetical protein